MSFLTRLPQDEAERIQRRLSAELLSSPTEFDLESLSRRNWVAVPVRDEIADDEAVWIGAAIAELGESKAVCVTTEPKIHLEAYEVGLSEDGLLDFHYNCMLRAFLLAPESLTFALLDQANYFYILAGPVVFVEGALGKSRIEALNSFQEYTEGITAARLTRKWLKDTAERYRPKE